MAEQEKKVVIDKKAIKMQKLSEKPLSEYTEAVASAEGKPEAGSAAALVAALAPALGSLAAALAGVDPEGEHKELVAELNEMRKYMLKQVDEMPRSRAPLVKRISEQADGLHLESAARVACSIPNEVVYLMCRCMELLDELMPLCRAEDKPTVQAAAYLCLAAISVMRGQIAHYTTYMDDESFRYVCKREAEINVQQHQGIIDRLMAPTE